jgi:hypothetical protein
MPRRLPRRFAPVARCLRRLDIDRSAYVTHYFDRSGRRIANDANSRWIFPAFWELHRVLKPDSYAVSFYGWGNAERFLAV